LILPDVNVLVAAYQKGHVHHEAAYNFLNRLQREREILALCDVSLTGLIRIVSHPKIFRIASPLENVFSFVNEIIRWPSVVRVAPGIDHWKIFESMCHKSGATGGMVTDAYIAALAVEHGCAVATFDNDFQRFPNLRVLRPE
jgi:toxin-antitoxin system PIN domain toxin